jgi:hypothetical protein
MIFFASMLAGALGLLAVYVHLRREFAPAIAALTTALLLGGTSLFWSMTRDNSPLETIAFALVAIALLLSEWQSRRVPNWLWWALIAAIPPLVSLGVRASSLNQPFAAQGGWMAPLFSSSSGLLSLTPVVYVAVVGTLAAVRRKPMWTLSTIATVALWIGVNRLMDASGDQPFGHGLTAALAILAPGLAFALDRARVRPVLAVAPLVIAAVLWNYWLMVQYTIGLLPKDAPVSFSGMVRQQATVATQRPFVYPFAFPANVWFAWRERVPVDRYELLAGEPRQANVNRTMDRAADRFLLDGWDAPGSDAQGPVRWIRDRRATLAFSLEPTPGRDLDVRVMARARLEEPAVDAIVGLEINDVEVGRFVVPSAAPLELTLKLPAAIVGRTVRAGYNRLTFVSHGVQRVDPSDQRPAGPLGRRVGNRAWPVAIYSVQIAPS